MSEKPIATAETDQPIAKAEKEKVKIKRGIEA